MMARVPASRLLTWLMAVAGVLAAVKLVGLALMLGGPALSQAGRVMVPAAVAAGHEAASGPAPQGVAVPPVPVQATPVSAAAGQGATLPEPTQLAAATPAPEPEPGPTPAERALLLDLRSRRIGLEERARGLDAREALLAAAEKRLGDRVQQLSALQTKLEALDQARRERDEANWRSLVKTYETMRPRDAAAIMNDLEQSVLMQVLDRMKEAKVAPILAAMQPERARAATADLARWRNRTVEPQG